MGLTPEERRRFLDFATHRQDKGEIFGWALDEATGSARVFVPSDRAVGPMPAVYAGIEIDVVRIPTPKEQHDV